MLTVSSPLASALEVLRPGVSVDTDGNKQVRIGTQGWAISGCRILFFLRVKDFPELQMGIVSGGGWEGGGM